MSHWLDRIIAEQRQLSAAMYGDPDLVSKAAEATEIFSDYELEEFVASQHS